jgi:hypothetical protein
MAFSLSNLFNLTSTLLLALSDPLQQLFTAPNNASSASMAAKPTGLLATKGIELLTWGKSPLKLGFPPQSDKSSLVVSLMASINSFA